MTNLKLTIDAKSFMLGLMVCAVFFMFSAFNSSSSEQNAGRYVVKSDDDSQIILDIHSGEFIINNTITGTKPRLFKYSFKDTPTMEPK